MNPTVVITGASDGIGAASARALASRGDHVLLVGRNPDKTAAVAKEVGADFLLADYTRLDDVRRLAAELQDRCDRIDVLMNNAGGIMHKRELTPDGFERTFQVNHLGGFLLTGLLLDTLKQSRASVINTSSVANHFGHINIDDLNHERRYSAQRAYGDGKLANILHVKELHRRFHADGLNAVAVHPGAVNSNFGSESNLLLRLLYHTPLASRFLISTTQGAAPLVRLATEQPGSDWESGAYYSRFKVGRTNRQAGNGQLGRDLWQRSAEMVGLPDLA